MNRILAFILVLVIRIGLGNANTGELCKMDLYFMFDATSSQTDATLNDQKTLATTFCACFTLSGTDTKVSGSIIKGGQSEIAWSLDEGIERTVVDQKISAIEKKTGSGTAIEVILKQMVDIMAAPPPVNGDRADVQSVIVMITDGDTADKPLAYELAKKLRDEHGFKTFAIGILDSGTQLQTEVKDRLTELTGDAENVVFQDDIDALSLRLFDLVCKPPPEGSCPLTITHIVDTSENVKLPSPPPDREPDLKAVHKNVPDFFDSSSPTIFGRVGPGPLQTHIALYDLMSQNFAVVPHSQAPPSADALKQEIMDMPILATASSKLTILLRDDILPYYQSLPPPRTDTNVRAYLVLINSEGMTYENTDLPQTIADLKALEVTVAAYDSSLSNGNGGYLELRPHVSLGSNPLVPIAIELVNLGNLADFNNWLSAAADRACAPPGESTAPPFTLPPPSVFCEQCWERRNQKPFYANPENCSTYYHCFRNGSQIEGILRPCADGLRFAERTQACVPKWNEDSCAPDPCENSTIMMEGWWQDDRCGIFYQCSNYYSIKMCCPANHRFNKTWGDCMYDKSCNDHNDECEDVRVTVPMFTPIILPNETCYDVQYDVKRQVDPNNPHKYFVIWEPYVNDVRKVPKLCPRGTLFQLETCKCSNHTDWVFEPPKMRDCLLNITFDETPIEDFSKYKFWVDNTGKKKVKAQGSTGVFDGMSYIEIPGLQGNALGAMLTISFWMFSLCDPPIDPNAIIPSGGLFSNRGEKIPGLTSALEPSVLIRTENNRIIGGIRTIKQSLIDSVSFEITCNKWWHITLVYRWQTLTLYVNCARVDVEEALVDAPIYWMLFCPLAIGNDQHHGFYKGNMDEILMCREAFTQEEVCERFNDQKSQFPPSFVEEVENQL